MATSTVKLQSISPAASERRWWGVALVVIYAVLVTSGLLAAALANPLTDHGFVYELGRSFALAGIALLTMQFVLTARFRWLDRPFGLDALYKYHKSIAVLILGLLVMHPILLALGGAGFRLIYRLGAPWPIWFGRVALVLLLAQVLGAAFRTQLRIGFERWRLLHNQATVIFGLGAIHARIVGGDLETKLLQALWALLVVVAAGSWGYHKLIAPAIAKARSYRVLAVHQETPNVWTLQLEPPAGGKRFDYRPGQFHFLHLRRGRRLPSEEHPFTISSSPTREHLSSTIKESGDFTHTIGQTQTGDRIAIRGPYGRFSYTYYPERKDIVMIAGGIGITPLMSMLRHMRDSQFEAQVLLIFANRTEHDIAFRTELEEMTTGERPRVKLIHVLSQPDQNWSGESGFVDREKLERFLDNGYREKMFYLCGPPPMMKKVIADLTTLGVPEDRIEYEFFSL